MSESKRYSVRRCLPRNKCCQEEIMRGFSICAWKSQVKCHLVLLYIALPAKFSPYIKLFFQLSDVSLGCCLQPRLTPSQRAQLANPLSWRPKF